MIASAGLQADVCESNICVFFIHCANAVRRLCRLWPLLWPAALQSK